MTTPKSFHDEFTRIVELRLTEPELDWRKEREEILALHEIASEDHEFEATLQLYWALMGAVKRQSGVTDLEKFEKLNSQEYATLLISENIRGRTDGNIDPLKMKKIAEREIIAGRMKPDDELYKMTLQFLEPTPKAEKKSFFKRFLGL